MYIRYTCIILELWKYVGVNPFFFSRAKNFRKFCENLGVAILLVAQIYLLMFFMYKI